jgi:hypothetical protein
LAVIVETDLLQKLGSKEISKAQLFHKVESDFSLVPLLLEGTLSSRATVRYGCGSVLMDLSEKYPNKLYPYMDNFISLLDSKHRILTWNAMAAIANLTAVDSKRKFDAIFDKYYSFLGNDYMVTVSNIVVNSAKIASNKPYLAEKITPELLKVQNLKVTPHLTDECKLVIAEQTLKTFEKFFGNIDAKEPVIAFAKEHIDSSRTSLRKEAQRLLKSWEKTLS